MRSHAISIGSTARACFSLFRIKTAEGFQYRLAWVSGAAVGIFWALIEITVLAVFYNYAENKEAGTMAGLTLRQVVTYVWVAQAIWTMQPMSIDSDILSQINSGDVGIELCRPIDLYFHWFAKIAAGRLAPLFWRGSLTLLCGTLMPPAYRLSWPASLPGFLWTVVSLSCAFLLCTAFAGFVSTVRLNVAWGDGPVYMLMFIGSVLSGSTLPLQLWPEPWQRVLLWQPFAGYMDIPIRLYIGTMHPGEAHGGVLLQVAWILFFVVAGKLLMARRLRTIVVQGG
ncbi:MAG: ABC transporter permease [Limnochordia bacterium]|jgi:ABC-2 type transport system permease protein